MATESTYRNKLTERLIDGSLECGSLGYHALQPGVLVREFNGLYAPYIEEMVLGDPLGNDTAMSELVEKLNLPDFLQIGTPTATRLQALGYNIALMGVEAFVELPFALTGESKSDLRRARNRSARNGIVVSEVLERDRDRYANAINEFNHRWLSSRKTFNREFAFLARPFESKSLPHERRFIARRRNRVVGIACYDPIWIDGYITGYLEAIVRADDSSVPGTRDALTLTAMQFFQREGVSEISLGLCPFHRPAGFSPEGIENSPISESLFYIFYNYAQFLFNSRGLAFHKSRYRPRYSPVYVASHRSSPFAALYRACQISGIDPAFAARRAIRRLLSGRLPLDLRSGARPALENTAGILL